MGKHDEMVQRNKTNSQMKIDKAIATIRQMLKDDEQVVVCSLVKKTGYSRSFFYNNDAVHAELEKAQHLQEGKSFVAPQKVILDKAMDKEISLLKRKLKERDSEIMELQKEVVKLKKALSVQAVKALNEL